MLVDQYLKKRNTSLSWITVLIKISNVTIYQNCVNQIQQ